MKVIGVTLFAVFIGAGIYFGLVHPSFADSPGESYAWTKNCVDKTPGLTENTPLSRRLTVAHLRAIAMNATEGTAAALFADSSDYALRAERELRAVLKKGGVAESEFGSRVRRSGSELLILGQGSGHLAPQGSKTFTKCVYAIRTNRSSGWTGFDTKEIDRPFLRR